jgi:hypothetical protein
MFDKISDAAGKLATDVSRRAFLGRLGESALGLAAAIGGILAFPTHARAGNQMCCLITNLDTCCCARAVAGRCDGRSLVPCSQCSCPKC